MFFQKNDLGIKLPMKVGIPLNKKNERKKYLDGHMSNARTFKFAIGRKYL